MFIEVKKGDAVYMQSTLINYPHAFSTRHGGVSDGTFDSLNLKSNRGDDPAKVMENYGIFCGFLGKGKDETCVTNQVHGDIVKIVDRGDMHVFGSDVPYEADGIVTCESDLPVVCFTADCVPVLMADEEHGVIAAVHCGWKSSVADILKNAVEKMKELGASVGNIRAAMGASIGACCFETDDDVPEAVVRYLGGEQETDGLFVRREDGKTMVDLREANRRRLLQLGVPAENIDVSSECTYCGEEKYFSYRRQKGINGSLGAIIMMP